MGMREREHEKGSRSKKTKKQNCEFSLNAFKAYWLQTLIKADKNYEKLTVLVTFILDLFVLILAFIFNTWINMFSLQKIH